MKLDIIEEFYLNLYTSLLSNKNLEEFECNVYLKIPKEPNYPFITIDYENVNWVNLYHITEYNFTINVSLFANKLSITTYTKIFTIVTEAFKNFIANFNKLELISLNNNNLSFTKSKDLLTDKILNKFKLILREKLS